jgi:hypothetical protein
VSLTEGLQTGADGVPRCAWATSAPEYVAYHDEEWGRPVRGDDALFERLCLEAFQSGLSWLTILRKREGFRAAFAGFAIERVAAFGKAGPSATARITNLRMKPGGLSALTVVSGGRPAPPVGGSRR